MPSPTRSGTAPTVVKRGRLNRMARKARSNGCAWTPISAAHWKPWRSTMAFTARGLKHWPLSRRSGPSLWICPATTDLSSADIALVANEKRSFLLHDALHQPAIDTFAFDYVLIDCPPSLGQLTQAALSASTEVLMPIQCEFYAMEGLTQMIHVIRDVMQRGEGRLTFGGILLTMYDPSLELTHEVDTEVREFFGDIVFDTVIPRDVAVSEAPSHGQSVMDYAPRSRGCRAYLELCMEVLERD